MSRAHESHVLQARSNQFQFPEPTQLALASAPRVHNLLVPYAQLPSVLQHTRDRKGLMASESE